MRRFRSFSGAALAVCLAIPAYALPSPDRGLAPATDAKVHLLIQASQRAFDKGLLLLAVTQAKTAVYLAPLSGEARLQLGICLMQAGDAYNAEDQLRRARFAGAPDAQVLPHLFEAMLARGEYEPLLEEFADPGMPPSGANAAEILRARAVALQEIGKPRDANESMDRSLALRRDRKGIIIRANLALQQGDMKLAKSLSDDIVAANPKDAESLDLKTRLALAMSDTSLAVQTADQLVALDPKSLNSRFTRISVYIAANMDDKARADLNLVRSQFPNLLMVAYYHALLLARAGDVGEAWKTGMTLPVEFDISSPDVGENLAEMAAQSGHLEPAAAILHAVIAKWPNATDARLDLVAIRLRQKNPTDALSVLLPLDGSKDSVVAMYFARTYMALHRPTDAKSYFAVVVANGGAAVTVAMSAKRAADFAEGWLAVRPDDSRARRQYAQLLMTRGRFADAKAQYELLVQTAPPDVSVMNNLAWLLTDSDPRRALALAADALKLAPNAPSVLDTEGWIKFRQNNKTEALRVLEQAHGLRPQSGTISYHYAAVLNSVGRRGEAKNLLKAALMENKAYFTDRQDAERLLASMH